MALTRSLTGLAFSVGLSGVIGSGKSHVRQVLSELGALCIDSDRVGHDLYRPGSEAAQAMSDTFGTQIIAPDGSVDRAALGQLLFHDPDIKARVNEIMWPRIYCEVQRRLGVMIEEARQRGATGPLVGVVEAALILEAGWKHRFDELWLAYAPHEDLAHRLAARHGGDMQTARKRLAAQLPAEEQRIHADVIICTDGTHEQTRAIVRSEWDALQSRVVAAAAAAAAVSTDEYDGIGSANSGRQRPGSAGS